MVFQTVQNAVHIGVVLQKHGVDGKDGSGVQPNLLHRPFVQPVQGPHRPLLGGVKAVDLLLGGELGDAGRSGQLAVEEVERAVGKLCLNGFSGDDLHTFRLLSVRVGDRARPRIGLFRGPVPLLWCIIDYNDNSGLCKLGKIHNSNF